MKTFFKLSKFAFSINNENVTSNTNLRRKMIRQYEQKIQKKWNNFDFNNPEEQVRQYQEFIERKEKQRLNFNRPDRWQQRELNDIYNNFDIKQLKFRDFSALKKEMQITNKTSFSSVEEILFYLETLFKKGILEKQCEAALDVFLKEFNTFDSSLKENKHFVFFIRQLSQNIVGFTKHINYYKTAKFLDWFNIDDLHCWLNLERAITNNHSKTDPAVLLKCLNHFANQDHGSGEFYDLMQYLFWDSKFDKVSNSDFISLGYNMFITQQGYKLFFQDYSKALIPRLSRKDSTIDLLRVLQTFSEISEFYADVYSKVEEILLGRCEQLNEVEACVVACGYSVAGYGTPMLFERMERIILVNLDLIEDPDFKGAVKGLIVSVMGSENCFKVLEERICRNINLFSVTDRVYIMKSYEKKNIKSSVYQVIEQSLGSELKNAAELSLEEICVIVDGYCSTGVWSREFQKLVELAVASRIKDIRNTPLIAQFLYETYFRSKKCSIRLMEMLSRCYTNTKI